MFRNGWRRKGAVLGSAVLLAACGGGDDPQGSRTVQVDAGQPVDTGTAQSAQPVAPPPPPPPDLRLEVNLAQRQLHVYRSEQRVASHPVAVGSSEWPTPTGEWTVGQVVWNPRWIPPEEEWAEDEEVAEPGDPENPLGRAQLVYRAPNSIHGTNDPASLGKAVSHGSIRVSNEVAMELARQVMEAGGAGRDEAWYESARSNRSQRQSVAIPNPIPIRVIAGEGSGGGQSKASTGSSG